MPAERRSPWLRDAERIDVALYSAVALTPTPGLDGPMRALSRAADHGVLWLAVGGLVALGRGARGRRAARAGVASLAVTSAVVNGAIKPLARRGRPDPAALELPVARHLPMPSSRSLPSGHAASAFAFATGVGHVLAPDAIALRALAAAVGYSRVHTGVHFPADVVAGAVTGTVLAQATARALDRLAA